MHESKTTYLTICVFQKVVNTPNSENAVKKRANGNQGEEKDIKLFFIIIIIHRSSCFAVHKLCIEF